MNSTGCQAPESCYYSNTDPTAKSLASQIRRVGRDWSKTFKTGAAHNKRFKVSNAYYCFYVQLKRTFFLVKEVKGYAISENLNINFL